MKACPYCAEMIQDAAAKCRFCGEWLDPTKRPEWSNPTGWSAGSPAESPRPVDSTQPRALGPTGEVAGNDGPATRPRSATRTWSAPAWMERNQPTRTTVIGSAPSYPASDPAPPEPTPNEPTPNDPTPAAPTSSPYTESGEVALRMQRIQASAAAVRNALIEQTHSLPPQPGRPEPVQPEPIQPEPLPPEPTLPGPLPAETPLRASVDPAPGPERGPVRARSPSNAPSLALSSDFDGFDDFDADGGDDDLDDDFGDVGARRPLPWRSLALGAAVVLASGVAAFWDKIAPGEAEAPPQSSESDPATDPNRESGSRNETSADPAGNQVAQGSLSPTRSSALGHGQPVVPERASPSPSRALRATANAGTDATAGTTPPFTDAMKAELAEAQRLYQGGGGRRLRDAKTRLERLVGVHPHHPGVLLALAQVELELGNPTASLKTATACTEVAAHTADCWLTIGVLKQDADEADAAIAAYERYLTLAPGGSYADQVAKQLERLR